MPTDRDDDRWGDEPDDRPADRPGRGAARSKVKAPAIGLIVVAALQLLSSAYNMYSLSSNALPAQFEAQRKQIDDDPNMPAAQKQQTKDFLKTYEAIVTPALPIGVGLGVITAILVVIGGIKMYSLSSLGWARTASILSLIPCFVCCLWGLPIGIWALVTLSNADVKAAFAANKAPARRDVDENDGWGSEDRGGRE